VSEQQRVTTRQLAELAGITYRQADYWCRRGFLLHSDPQGSGSRRTHPTSEVMVADALRQVVGAGCLVGAQVADTVRDLPPGWGLPIYLDDDGCYTDDIEVARWVVQPHPELLPA
jgi:hypothetical protein